MIECNLSYTNNTLSGEVIANTENCEYYFYLLKDGEIISRHGWQPSPIFNWTDLESGTYQIRGFWRSDRSKLDKFSDPLTITNSSTEQEWDQITASHDSIPSSQFETYVFRNTKLPLWPWAKMDIAEVANKASLGFTFIPNIGFISIDDINTSLDNDSARNTKLLWLNSLVTAHACLQFGVNQSDGNEYINLGFTLINEYLCRYDSNEGIFSVAWKDEHAVANRLFVISAFLYYADRLKINNERNISIVELLLHGKRHADWLYEDANYAINNHGVMMDLSLAQFGQVIKKIDRELTMLYINKAQERLLQMARKSFDKDGCCTENSPAYHFVNYALFSSAISNFIEYGYAENNSEITSIIEKARNVGHQLIRADGSIPLIGDSECSPSTFFPSRDLESNEIGYYPDAGFFILSNSDVHFTYKAGGQSFSHRHVDDLSITLFYSNKDFIVDSGLYNYDISDKLRRWFMSSYAHSGIYIESMGDVRFANFASPMQMSRFTGFSGDSSSFSVSGAHNLSSNTTVFREISFKEKILSIKDVFNSKNEERWRIQFHLHPDVSVSEISPNTFSLHNDGRHIILHFESSRKFLTKIDSSNYSEKFLKLQKTKSIVAFGTAESLEFCTKILLK